MQYDYQSPTNTRAAELLPTQNQMPFLERLLGQWWSNPAPRHSRRKGKASRTQNDIKWPTSSSTFIHFYPLLADSPLDLLWFLPQKKSGSWGDHRPHGIPIGSMTIPTHHRAAVEDGGICNVQRGRLDVADQGCVWQRYANTPGEPGTWEENDDLPMEWDFTLKFLQLFQVTCIVPVLQITICIQ